MRKDVPAPPARLAIFAEYFASGVRAKCIGWDIGLGHAVTVKDGWIIEVGVSPKLCDPEGFPVIILGLDTREIWHITKGGEATCQGVKPPAGPPIKYIVHP